eukprot:CAMPEP_0178930232 /NCGR_PEP_ID=MMETSP0786-20121207/21102_1 /TAXON_ID=186022 /ORGANISM="Thalassionema frauenfeldii, Strain CCMP 1798" /LENGTH=738 /DNA_ID=CAMNT_0020606699 /DNA_START=108 /DNA_END=2321 /DNA_ORIENTATION=+
MLGCSFHAVVVVMLLWICFAGCCLAQQRENNNNNNNPTGTPPLVVVAIPATRAPPGIIATKTAAPTPPPPPPPPPPLYLRPVVVPRTPEPTNSNFVIVDVVPTPELTTTTTNPNDFVVVVQTQPPTPAPTSLSIPGVIVVGNPTTTPLTVIDGIDSGIEPLDVDIELMADHVEDMLQDEVMGFSTMITKQQQQQQDGGGVGTSVATRNWGIANDDEEEWTNDHQMAVASVSKTLTAIGTLKLLHERGISIHDPIASWLPPDWIRGDGWESVTFVHLLTHTSGVNQAIKALSEAEKDNLGNDWDGLRYLINMSVVPNSSSDYKNANYALLRIIVPTIWTSGDDASSSPAFGQEVNEFTHGLLFVGCMQDYVFEPAGVYGVSCTATESQPVALMYNFTDDTVPGQLGDVSIYGCGAHAGWMLSTTQLSAVLVHLRHDPSYIPSVVVDAMDLYKLGWNQLSNDANNGRLGKYWHGGDWFRSGTEAHSCVMTMRDHGSNVEATLLVNSQLPGGSSSACTILKDAYNNARDGIAVPPAFCIPGTARVTVWKKGEMELSRVSLGDRVLVASGPNHHHHQQQQQQQQHYETIYSFGHYHPTISSHKFMTIDCTDDEGHYYSLTLTPSHMIVTEHGGVIPASMVIQGDRIRTGDGTVAVVTRITKNVKKQGMYAPFTESGYLIVDGLVVSNYVALLLLDESSYNSWFLWNHHHQWLSHTLTLPRRWYCHYYDCTNETYTAEGIATW